MSYVAYHTETTKYAPTGAEVYATEAAAKAALTRMCKKNPELNRDDYSTNRYDYFKFNVEKEVERTNSMTGKKFMESVNTPYYCSPSSETYFSS